MPFVDEVVVKLKAGNGGDGCMSFRREKFIPRGGPDGGDGAYGGDIVVFCDENTTDLSAYQYVPEWKAQDGGPGMGAQCFGKEGKDTILKVPEGTEVYDLMSGKKVAELLTHGQEVRLLKGGRGGLGNIHFKNSINRAPRQTTKGKMGHYGEFRFELKSIADIGLVGFPNAGKSSLINQLTRAGSKVAAYPFTTLNPQLGRVIDAKPKKGGVGKTGKMATGKKIVIADIPGLIEGAHQNRGLGIKFLKHIERCKLLLFVIDAAGSEGRKPAADYKALLWELAAYSPALAQKPRIVVANKADLLTKKLPKTTFGRGEEAPQVVEISALTGEGIEKLKKVLAESLG